MKVLFACFTLFAVAVHQPILWKGWSSPWSRIVFLAASAEIELRFKSQVLSETLWALFVVKKPSLNDEVYFCSSMSVFYPRNTRSLKRHRNHFFFLGGNFETAIYNSTFLICNAFSNYYYYYYYRRFILVYIVRNRSVLMVFQLLVKYRQ